MPQPLSEVKPDCLIHIGSSSDNPSDHRPQLALLAMKVLSEWAILESHVHELFVHILGANPLPAATMFAALGGQAQRDVAKAVAKVTLSGPERTAFDAIFGLYIVAARDRNKLAHWVWGHSPQLPDAVLLCDPDELIVYEAHMRVFDSEITDAVLNGNPRPELPYLARERILVYEASDFAAISNKFQRIMSLIGQLTIAIRVTLLGNRDGRLIAKLHQEPEILEYVDRQRRRKNSP